MENEVAVELLKIAATITVAALDNQRATASPSGAGGKAPTVEVVFSDCRKMVEAHFASLTGK